MSFLVAGTVQLSAQPASDVSFMLFAFRDQHTSSSASEESEDVIRLQYSMAIVRMVNGISDKAQKGKTAVSVSSNAAAAGNPAVLCQKGCLAD